MFLNILNYIIHGIILIVLVICCAVKCVKIGNGEVSRVQLAKETARFSYIAATALGALGLIGLILSLCTR